MRGFFIVPVAEQFCSVAFMVFKEEFSLTTFRKNSLKNSESEFANNNGAKFTFKIALRL